MSDAFDYDQSFRNKIVAYLAESMDGMYEF